MQLTVRDTGVGIPQEALPHMFERFHRIERNRGRTHEGTGIGLALVKELVLLHGGTITVDSVVGKGSTFTVTIPTGKAHLDMDRIGPAEVRASTALRPAAFVEEALRWLPDSMEWDGAGLTGNEETLQTPLRAPRILWADDNADMRAYVSRLLGNRYDVQAVGDGETALEAARLDPPALILTDVMMPKLDGYGLLQAVRANPYLRDIPVILLSARAGEDSRIEGVEAGADDYLVKPFSANELLARMETALQLRHVRSEARAQFETLLNEAPLGVYLVDEDFRIRLANPKAVPVFGNIPDLIGRDFDEVIHRLWPKESADELVRLFRHTLETGEPYEQSEYSSRRLDRTATEHYEWRIRRIPLPSGRFGVVCYFRDISAQMGVRKGI